MANSVTNLDLISSSQAQKEITANALFDASGPATLFGRRSSTTTALTWGYYGGNINNNSVLVTIPNGVIQLTANTTNYLQSDGMGNISVNTTGFLNGYTQLYTVLTGASSVVSYNDLRCFLQFSSGSSYTLMPATSTTLGGVKIGSGLTIDGTGLVSLNYSYTLNPATATVLGGIKVGNTLTVAGDGLLNYNLPVASTTVSGGVKVDGTTITIDGSGIISSAGGGGGLPDFTETLVTTAPYNTTLAGVKLEATNATASKISIAIVPKGTGAFQLNIANNAISGGNVRGDNAVDLQSVRSAANQVASGIGSFAAGRNNIASGQYGVAIGYGNTASGTFTISMGDSNVVASNGQVNAAIGRNNNITTSCNHSISLGQGNSHTGGDTGISIGSSNLIDNDKAIVMGERTSNKGMAHGLFYSTGDSNGGTGGTQRGFYLIRRAVNPPSIGTVYGLNSNNQASSASNQINLRDNEIKSFFGHVVLRDNAGGRACWKVEGCILREAGVASTALLGTPTITSMGVNPAATGIYTLTVVADTTNGGLQIAVTTTTTTVFKIAASIQTTEVIGVT